MKISVIIPTCQPGGYLFECLDSLQAQNMEHALFEVIIILNGEKDPYEEKIRYYLKEEWREIAFQYRHLSDRGVSKARNLGLEVARGEKLLFLDDDDWISPNYLKEMIDCVPEDGIAVSNVKTWTPDTKQLGDDYLSKAYQTHRTGKSGNIFPSRSFLSSSCCKLIPRGIIASHRFAEDVSHGEDSLFMFLISPAIRSIQLCPDPSVIYYRRLRQDSTSRKRYPFARRLHRSWKLVRCYTRIYLHSVSTYSLPLYLSRVLAAVWRLFEQVK